MQDQEKKAHAMTSFALFGGTFGSPREKSDRAPGRPQEVRPFWRK